MTGKDVLPGKDLLEKTVEKQHQKLNKTFEFYEEELVTIKKEEPATIKKKN